MIRADATLRLAVLPLAVIRVTEAQPRYLDRVAHYVGLLTDPRHAGQWAGVLAVRPLGDGVYELLDGHHRFCASIIAGRGEALCLVIEDPEEGSWIASSA